MCVLMPAQVLVPFLVLEAQVLVLVLVLESQVLDNNTGSTCEIVNNKLTVTMKSIIYHVKLIGM